MTLQRIGAAGDYSLQIGDNVYRLIDLYSKTLYAAKPLNVYTSPAAVKISAKLKVGDPVGTVRGYYPAGRGSAKKNFVLVGPNSRDLKAIEYDPSNFSETKLEQQGVKTAKQVSDLADKAAEEDKEPWYSNLIKKAGPWVIGGLIGTVAIKTFIQSKYSK